MPIEEIGERNRAGGKIWFAFAEGDELFGVRVRKRAEEDGVDYGEKRGVGADAESENENGGGGEGGIVAKDAKGEAKILQQGFGERKCGLIEDGLFGLLEAA